MRIIETVKRIIHGVEAQPLLHQCTTCGVTFDAPSAEERSVECPNCASTRVLELPEQ